MHTQSASSADTGRIAEVIASAAPDIIALQELDVGRARAGDVDQAHEIARYLNMDVRFHPALHVEEEKYGDAILTALPSRLIKAGPPAGIAGFPSRNQKGCSTFFQGKEQPQ